MKAFPSILVAFLVIMAGASEFSRETDIPPEVLKYKPYILKVIAYDDEGFQVDEGCGFLIGEGQLVTSWRVAVCAHRLDVETSDGRFHSTAAGYVHGSHKTDTYLVFVDLPLEAAPIVVLKKKVPKKNEPVFLIETEGGSQSGVTPATFGWPSKELGFFIPDLTPDVKVGALLVTRDGEPIGLVAGGSHCVPSSVLLSLKKDKLRTFEENWTENSVFISRRLKQEAEIKIGISYNLMPMPDDTGLWGKAEIKIGMQNYADAYRMLKKANQLTSERWDLHEINGLLGRCSWELGKYDEVVVSLLKYIELGEKLASEVRNIILNDKEIRFSHGRLALAYYHLKEYDNALAICNRGIEHYGADELLYSVLGLIYNEKGRYEQALSAFQNALQIKNDSFLALLGMGETYEKMGKVSEAIAAYERAVSLAPPGDSRVAIAARLAELKKKKREPVCCIF